MSYDENRMSDLIDAGNNKKKELEDKAITMMQLLANEAGASFEDEEIAHKIIVETFKNM